MVLRRNGMMGLGQGEQLRISMKLANSSCRDCAVACQPGKSPNTSAHTPLLARKLTPPFFRGFGVSVAVSTSSYCRCRRNNLLRGLNLARNRPQNWRKILSHSRKHRLYSISLALLSLLKGLHRSVQGMFVVSSKLWVGTFEGRVSVGLWLLDTRNRTKY